MKISNKTLTDYANLEQAVSASSIISRTNSKGIITSVNENFTKISGYNEDELLGKSHNVINSKFHPKEFWIDMWKVITSGNSWRGEVRNQAKDGSHYWVDTFIYPITMSKSGNPTEYLSVRNDITEKKQFEADLVHRNNILATIAWKQSHEMRRPVASILGLLQLIKRDDTVTGLHKEIVDRLHLSAAELDQFVRSIVRLTEEGERQTADSSFTRQLRW